MRFYLNICIFHPFYCIFLTTPSWLVSVHFGLFTAFLAVFKPFLNYFKPLLTLSNIILPP